MQLLAADCCYFGCKNKLDYIVGLSAISWSHSQIIAAEQVDYHILFLSIFMVLTAAPSGCASVSFSSTRQRHPFHFMLPKATTLSHLLLLLPIVVLEV
jgi:hypothetical protein